jgi:hypothetical protein
MSQTGAYAYANQGYDYRANLGRVLSWGSDCEVGVEVIVSLWTLFPSSSSEKAIKKILELCLAHI